jgi:hypothetical protein
VEGDGVRITAEDLTSRANQEAALTRGELADPEKKRAFVDRMVDLEVLAAEARRLGLDRDPELATTIKQLLAQRLTSQHFARPDQAWTPGQEELRVEYGKQRERFLQPERVRVHLLLAPGVPGSPELERAGARLERAREALLARRSGGLTETELAALAPSVTDLGLRTREELAARLGQAMAEEAFALVGPGAVSGVRGVPGGKGLLRLAAHEPALPLPFEQVSGALAASLARDRRAQQLQAWTQELRAARQVRIDRQALEAVDVLTPRISRP